MAGINIVGLRRELYSTLAAKTKISKAPKADTSTGYAKEIDGKFVIKYSSAWGQRYIIKLPGELTSRRVNINSLQTGEIELSISIYNTTTGSTVTSFDGHENMDSNYYFCRMKKIDKDNKYEITNGPRHSDYVTTLSDDDKTTLAAILKIALASEDSKSENAQILIKTIEKLQEKQEK